MGSLEDQDQDTKPLTGDAKQPPSSPETSKATTWPVSLLLQLLQWLPQTQPKLRGRRRPRLRSQSRLLRLTLPRRHRLLLERRPKGTVHEILSSKISILMIY